MNAYSLFLVYLFIISLLAVFLTIRDKNAARKNTWRVKERTLLAVSVFGGSVAMLLTMLIIRHKSRHPKFMVGIPIIIMIQAVIGVLALSQTLSVSHYSVETGKISGQIKLALVADLHSCYYGKEQCELLNAINDEQPDAILLCGDIFDDKLPPDNSIKLIERISSRYKCFYVAGNHEFWSGIADEYKYMLSSSGVDVLEGNTETLDIRGDRIRICGIDDPDTDRFTSRSAPYSEQMKQLSVSVDNDLFTILLSHRPERINELLPLEADLIVSGHAHGGQWRIPFILQNGLLSPNQGLFPKYTDGEYFFEKTVFIVSRGLAKESTVVPRVFNHPEVVIITLNGGKHGTC